MHNGKFFTGLPPKMMERHAGAPNRLESHLFWPDDSRAESVPDARQKRRASLQAESPSSRDERLQRQSSFENGASDFDVKQRFKNEFANSSIQFYDSIQEEDMGSRQKAIRKPLIRQAMKQDIAIKPTAMNMKLYNGSTAAQEEYAAIKKNQAFNSKIEFDDYNDADGNGRQRQNNRIKPKMDMNDKKDVERNTKNSPKLQVKGIVPNLRGLDEAPRNNERNERARRSNDHEEEYQQPRQSTRFIRNEVRGDNEEFSGRSNNNQRYNERPIRADQHRENIDNEGHDSRYDDDVTDLHDIRKQFNAERAPRRGQNKPTKRILKIPIRVEGDFNDIDCVERGVQNIKIRPSPKKHVTYGDQVYGREENNGAFDYDDDTSFQRRENMETNSQNELKSTRNRSTSGNKQSQQKGRQTVSDYDDANVVTTNDEDLTEGNFRNISKNTLNPNNNNNHNQNSSNNQNDRKLNNLSQHQQRQQRQQRQREITPKISNSPMASVSGDTNSTSTSALSPTAMDAQKHLRSSLCFSDGEIVGSAEVTPTSEANSRRTARSAATTRRVCVGLPD